MSDPCRSRRAQATVGWWEEDLGHRTAQVQSWARGSPAGRTKSPAGSLDKWRPKEPRALQGLFLALWESRAELRVWK